ncbi:MAG: FGGY-family carbohydrate kinase [Candidatus Nanopelagicales bacterium]
MTGDLVVGVDCSTTAAKAVVWDAAGRAVSSARVPYELSQPRPGWGEQNAEDWWSAFSDAVRRAVQTVDSSRIAALSLTHQRESFVCLDADGQPIRPAMLWLDGRATHEVQEFGTEDVHRVTGKPPNPTPGWYKLLWLAKHEPETMARVGKVVDLHGFVVHRLTGRWITSVASADPLGLVDLSTGDYDDALLAAAGLDRSQVPELVAPGYVVGAVLDELADDLGLRRGTRVVAGAGDGQAAQLGTGITGPGAAFLNLGSGIVSGTVSDTYSYGREYRTLCAATPGKYSLETFMGGGTFNLTWFVERFSAVDPRALGLDVSAESILETAAAHLPPGSEGLMVLPYWTGALTPYWDHDARGVMVGLTGVHGKSHVYRALLEGIAFEQRLLTEGLVEVLDDPVERVIVLGGGSRSSVWCQIIADVLRRPVEVVSEPESTCLGAGMLASVAAGIHPDLPSAAEAMSGISRRHEPSPRRSDEYDRLYAVYKDIYPSLQPLFGRLVAAQPGAGGGT